MTLDEMHLPHASVGERFPERYSASSNREPGKNWGPRQRKIAVVVAVVVAAVVQTVTGIVTLVDQRDSL